MNSTSTMAQRSANRARAPLLMALVAILLAGCSADLVELLPDYSSIPILVDDSLLFSAIGSGHLHTCAIALDDTPYCWGYNEYAQLGSLLPMDRCGEWPCTGEPQRVEGAPVLRTVGGGTTFTCGLDLAGAAYCWGRGKSLDGIVPSDAIPRKVAGDLTFEQLSMQAIADATCGIATDTILYCWGWGGWALPWIASEEPVAFETDLEFASVTIAQNHMCALTAAGSAYCWGSNWSGQLGIGSYGSAGGNAVVATPQLVLGGHAFTQLVASAMFTCGLTALGDVYCWGSIVADLSSNVPQRVVAVPAFAELYAGSGHLCGLTAAGEAYCWGENYLGALGDGTREHNSAPVAVVGGHRFAELTAASGHTCGLTTDGRAYCWGGNAHGQIGRPGFEAPPGMGWW